MYTKLPSKVQEENEDIQECLHRLQWNMKNIINNRRWELLLRWFVTTLIVIGFIMIGFRESKLGQTRIQEGIASEIIRFHVIANSDLEGDQSVKMKVKEAVITALRPKMTKTKDISIAREEIKEQMGFMKDVAMTTLRENGYDYDVRVTLQQEEFPVKIYGDITLPAGKYESLCIRLGEAEGKNWWCIVFPTLCYVDETYSVVPSESKEKLEGLLTEEEYGSITEKKETKSEEKRVHIKVKWKVWEYLKKYI